MRDIGWGIGDIRLGIRDKCGVLTIINNNNYNRIKLTINRNAGHLKNIQH
jgi:hypothetical protein